ncbi:MAG: hypothetical protein ABH873_04250 [Candidatus Firestonebacteria bacterium]
MIKCVAIILISGLVVFASEIKVKYDKYQFKTKFPNNNKVTIF